MPTSPVSLKQKPQFGVGVNQYLKASKNRSKQYARARSTDLKNRIKGIYSKSGERNEESNYQIGLNKDNIALMRNSEMGSPSQLNASFSK